MTRAERYVRDVFNLSSLKHVEVMFFELSPNEVILERIYSPKPGIGNGQKAMTDMASLADLYQVKIRLWIVNDKDEKVYRLIRWYQNFRFNFTGEEEDGAIEMLRMPKVDRKRLFR
jgi:hypothetical protein